MKRHRSTYSLLWHFFTKVDEEFAQCVICQRQYSYKSTTHNLKKHLDRQHPTAYPEEEVLEEEEMSLSPTTGELVSEDTLEEKPHADEASDALETLEVPDESDTFEDEQQLDVWDGDETQTDGGRRRFRTWQWRHFIRVDDTLAICRLCRGEYSHQSGNGNLKRHLETKHNITAHDVDDDSHHKPQQERSLLERRASVTGRRASLYQTRRKRSSVWNYFTEVNPVTAQCKFCRKQMSKGSVSNLRTHLIRTHAALMGDSKDIVRMSTSRDTKSEDLDFSNKRKTNDFDDPFTGVYISDPPLDDSETDEQPPPRQRRTDTDALEQFGRYIAVLMRRLPEDVSNRMQAEFVTQIMQAQIKYDSARTSENMLETSRHVNGQSSFDDTQESDKLASLMLDVST